MTFEAADDAVSYGVVDEILRRVRLSGRRSSPSVVNKPAQAAAILRYAI